MTERASDLLSELSERLTADLQDAGATASEAIRTSMPELDLTVPESFSEMPIRSSSQFLEALYRTLRIDSSVPWAQYYILAREASHRYAEKGVPLESLMEAMAIFRRAVISRITAEVAGSPYADEVVLLAQSRLGDVLEHLNSSFIRGYLDCTTHRGALDPCRHTDHRLLPQPAAGRGDAQLPAPGPGAAARRQSASARISRWIPSAASTRDRSGPARRRHHRRRQHQRSRARHRHRQPGRVGAGRLSGNHRVHLAADRTRGTPLRVDRSLRGVELTAGPVHRPAPRVLPRRRSRRGAHRPRQPADSRWPPAGGPVRAAV